MPGPHWDAGWYIVRVVVERILLGSFLVFVFIFVNHSGKDFHVEGGSEEDRCLVDDTDSSDGFLDAEDERTRW